MRLPSNRSQSRLPQRFPVGAIYVVEGYGGEAGKLSVIARYVVLPGGRRINVAADPALPPSPRALPLRHRPQSKQSGTKQPAHQAGKKFAVRRGTA